jgi:hypothetical protein
LRSLRNSSNFVPMEVIVRVAMDLDAVLITAVHSASFSRGGGGVSIPSRPLIKAYKRKRMLTCPRVKNVLNGSALNSMNFESSAGTDYRIYRGDVLRVRRNLRGHIP